MNTSTNNIAPALLAEKFPLSAKYDHSWMIANSMGPNALWLMEPLCRKMDLKPGMRVLDMGCGKAMSSIFLAKEFGVRVWANDLWITATENWQRIREAGVEDLVCPIHAEARALGYAEGFFDAIVSVDSYQYYGTDDLYFRYFTSFLKPGGQIGIVVPGLMQEFGDTVPEHLTRKSPSGSVWWDPGECFSFHTLPWWKRHWRQTQLADIEVADTLPDGCQDWIVWEKARCEVGAQYTEDELPTLLRDQGRYLGFVRLVARKRA